MIPEEDQLTVVVGRINFSTDLGTCEVIVEANEDTELHFTIRNSRENIQIKAFSPEYKETTHYLSMEEKKELQTFLNDTICNTSVDMLKTNRKNWTKIIGSLNLVSYGNFPEQENIYEQVMPDYLNLKEE